MEHFFNDTTNTFSKRHRIHTSAPIGLIFHPPEYFNQLLENPLLYLAKTGDSSAALKLVRQQCSTPLTLPNELKQLSGKKLTLMSVPSTTGRNCLPFVLGRFLSERLKKEFNIQTTFLNGDQLIATQHTCMLKLIPVNQRIFFPRRYTFVSNKAKDKLHTSCPIMLIEDLLVTGASAFAVKRFFDKNKITAPFLSALSGSADIVPDEKDVQTAITLLNQLDTKINWDLLTDELSREEINTLILRLKSAFNHHNSIHRTNLKNRLILTYRERVDGDTMAGRLLAADLKADKQEHTMAEEYKNKIQSIFRQFNTTVDDT